MPRFDLNGNPLPDDAPPPPSGSGGAPPPPHAGQPAARQQFDLAGNPVQMPPPPAPAPVGGERPLQGTPPQQGGGQQYDLMGNPIPMQAPPAPPPSAQPPYPGPGTSQPQMGYGSPNPQQPYAPSGGGYNPQPQFPFVTRPSVSAPQIPWNMIGGGVVAVIVIGVAIWALRMMNPAPIQAPASYGNYKLADGHYNLDKPIDWKISDIDPGESTDSKKIHGGVVLSDGSAQIEIIEGSPTDPTAKGAMFITQSRDAMSSNPVEMGSARYHHVLMDRFANVTQDAATYFRTPGFEGSKMFTFHADRPKWGFGGPYEGYYVSMAADGDAIIFICQGRESDWAVLQPVFDRAIKSFNSPTMIEEEKERSERAGEALREENGGGPDTNSSPF